MQELQAQIEALQAQAASLQETIGQRDGSITELQQGITDLKAQVAELEATQGEGDGSANLSLLDPNFCCGLLTGRNPPDKACGQAHIP